MLKAFFDGLKMWKGFKGHKAIKELEGCCMDALAAANTKHQPNSYIPSTLKTQNILILLLIFGADWSVRAILKISAKPTFDGVCTCKSIYST